MTGESAAARRTGGVPPIRAASAAADRTRRLAALDQAHIWHPFTQMQSWMEEHPLIIERAEGCELIDTEGRRYLDGVSSLWVNVHGHGHPAIDAAIVEQLGRLAHSTFLGLTHPPAIELAARLAALAPGRLERVFFSENGAASVEVALKMAYSYWRHRGEERPTFVRLENAYHGDTIGAVSIGGIDRFHETYRPLLFATAAIPSPYCYRCPLGLSYPSCDLACADVLDEVLTREGGRARRGSSPLRTGTSAGWPTSPGATACCWWSTKWPPASGGRGRCSPASTRGSSPTCCAWPRA